MASNDPKPDSTANNKPENPSDDARADVTAAVEELLNSLSNKFAGVSSEIFAKILTLYQVDEMSRRLDNLESALQENKSKDGGSTKPS
ncbi:hypothetical protein FGRMN_11203 [Fusarium graminum]|nr:hypothetical protein FGRMN_11203 [Fusarium graminum]